MVDVRRLVELVVATAEVIGDEIRPTTAALMVEELAAYPQAAVEGALASCRRELKGRLSLAAILERIDDGHPLPNEAWAIALSAADERNTVVWTEQTRDAWAAAQPLVLAGDRIAARMAFIEVYGRLLKEARNAKRGAHHVASIGHDSTGRDAVLRLALERGQIGMDVAGPHLSIAAPAGPGFNPVALLTGQVEIDPNASEKMRARLDQLRAELAAPSKDEAA